MRGLAAALLHLVCSELVLRSGLASARRVSDGSDAGEAPAEGHVGRKRSASSIVAEAPPEVAAEPVIAHFPELLEPFCNAGGLSYVVGMGQFDALAIFADACPDGHTLAALALLESGLPHHDPAVRQNATNALGQAAVRLVVEHRDLASECISGLEQALADDAMVIRVRAAEILGQTALRMHEEEHWDLAAQCTAALTDKALADGEIVVRKTAAEVLGGMAMRMVGSERGELAVRCVDVLARDALLDKAVLVRQSAAAFLGRVAVSAVRSRRQLDLVAECVAALSRTALADRTFGVRASSAESLGDVAVSLGEGGYVDLARSCVSALSESALQDVGYVSRIIRMHHIARRTAFGILGEVAISTIGQPGNLPAECVSVLAEKGLDNNYAVVRAHTAEILGNVALRAKGKLRKLASQCTEILSAKALEDRSRQVREAAAQALGRAS
mmetsp:Transcript_17280/g.49435  ORF Transcript_17280/g.49435 Transcript_17280/m.49435 type:complete len:444 (+) Transcript_17280:99-1430(+)